MILETERLYLREMNHDDYIALCRILQDEETMYAYEHAFSDAEVVRWLDNQLNRYKEDGLGLWAVVLKDNDVMIGQCGLTYQMIRNKKVVEVGYLFNKDYWHQGYAIEAARGCKEYAFDKGINEVYSIIRDNNQASINVALRNGMSKTDEIIKHYYHMDMLHFIYKVGKDNG